MDIPRWGIVTAAPHQFLVHLRNGEVLRGQQGGSCFKWPSDTVALVDTSVQRLMFTADQVTLEKTGVQVTGLAVYRVVEPLLAWRMLNLSEPDVCADILREMLLGATRRLVANLRLEECLTRRKDALAAELLAEIAPVVGGSGRDDDRSDRGWGIAVDTIEIQDVRVLSEEVFSRLQAPYREALELHAVRAKDEVAREQASLRHAAFQLEEERRQERMSVEEQRLEAERKRAVATEEHDLSIARRKSEARLDQERRTAEHQRRLAEQKLEQDLTERVRESETTRQVATANAENDVVVARLTAEAEKLLGEARADLERISRAATDAISDARLRELLVTKTLPDVARAYADSFDRIVVTGASDLSVLGQGVAQVLATAQALGLELPKG
ncbi:MAG: hypothetical protein H6738_13015 [Alphaproteobacteria bacterium]|nr:hypothetical protein [Alphaproteobacteria bacterium]MCB9697696.1 hypothetical protein [Alphaproteobacteria bacterium]